MSPHPLAHIIFMVEGKGEYAVHWYHVPRINDTVSFGLGDDEIVGAVDNVVWDFNEGVVLIDIATHMPVREGYRYGEEREAAEVGEARPDRHQGRAVQA